MYQAMAYEAPSLCASSVQWIGLSLSDYEEFGIPENCKVPLTPSGMLRGSAVSIFSEYVNSIIFSGNNSFVVQIKGRESHC